MIPEPTFSSLFVHSGPASIDYNDSSVPQTIRKDNAVARSLPFAALAMRGFSLLLVAAPLAAAVCYYPNGYSESSDEYQPCNQYSGAHSMCCGLNRPNLPGGSRYNGNTADTCLQNGLCENKYQTTADNGSTIETYSYFRDQCTSTNWSEDCLNVCTEEMDPLYGNSTGDAILTPCDGTSTSDTWCCGQTTDCCDKSPLTIAQIFSPGTTTTSASTATSTSTSSTTQHTATSAPTASLPSASPSESSSSSSSSSGLSSGAKAGVGVGMAVGAVALIAVVLFFLQRRNSKNLDYAHAPSPQELSQYQNQQQQPPLYYKPDVQEKSASAGDQRYEKAADREGQRFEMPS